MIRIIGLDFIGVVADYNQTYDLDECIKKAIRKANIDPRDKRLVLHAWTEHAARYTYNPLQTIKRLDEYFDGLRERVDDGTLARLGTAMELLSGSEFYTPRENLTGTLIELASLGSRLCIITHVRESVVSGFLQVSDLAERVWKIYSWPKKGKITGEVYDVVMRDACELGFAPKDILMVDDEVKKLVQARKRGFLTVLFCAESSPALTEGHAFLTISDLSELGPLVKDLSRLHGG